jgi:thioredoxin-dependent peroxiredoxin
MATQIIRERTGQFAWKGEPMTLLGTPVEAGDRAPDFNVFTVDLKPFHLKDALAGGTRAALFAVVPSIDTGICSRETHAFNERVTELPADKIGCFTVSMDLPFAQKRWCGAEGVDRMTMLSDYDDHSFGLAYGVRVKERGLLARSIFIVDKSGIVRTAQIMTDLTQEPNYDDVIAAAKAALT